MTNDLFSLEGKNALVTGANTGLGQAMAVALAGAGADVVLVGRSAPDETQARVTALGRKTAVVMADLSDTSVAPSVIAGGLRLALALLASSDATEQA